MSKKPENTGRKQDGTFLQGQSGNPAGKPKGAKHKATQAALALLDGEAEALTRKAVELALDGDTTALKICMDRIAPSLKSTSPMVKLDIPMPNSLAGTAKALIAASTQGDIAPDIAAQMVTAIASVARIEEIETLKHRVQAIETAMKVQKT